MEEATADNYEDAFRDKLIYATGKCPLTYKLLNYVIGNDFELRTYVMKTIHNSVGCFGCGRREPKALEDTR